MDVRLIEIANLFCLIEKKQEGKAQTLTAQHLEARKLVQLLTARAQKNGKDVNELHHDRLILRWQWVDHTMRPA